MNNKDTFISFMKDFYGQWMHQHFAHMQINATYHINKLPSNKLHA
jgi:hypothetical protein